MEITVECAKRIMERCANYLDCPKNLDGIYVTRPSAKDPLGSLMYAGPKHNPTYAKYAKYMLAKVTRTSTEADIRGNQKEWMALELLDQNSEPIHLDKVPDDNQNEDQTCNFNRLNTNTVEQNGLFEASSENLFEENNEIEIMAGLIPVYDINDNNNDVNNDDNITSYNLILYQPMEYNNYSFFKEIIYNLKYYNYICNKPRILVQFLMAHETNQIIILHGKPGAGKTSFATAIAKVLNGKHYNIQVRPNWVDNQDLVGFYNPVEKKYYPTPFLDILLEASNNPDTPYFITLDEMNLAYIEQYFSDILSAMETKERTIFLYSEDEKERLIKRYNQIVPEETDINELIEEQDSLEDKLKLIDLKECYENMEKYPPVFRLPDNVQFIGTLNMDATTKELSPKIIDRGFLIDFDGDASVEIADMFDEEPIEYIDLTEENSIYNHIKKHFSVEMSNRVKKHFDDMLKKCNENPVLKNLNKDVFTDLFIFSKILPMISAEEIEKINLDDFKEKYPFTFEKKDRMFKATDGEKGSYNYWRM